MTKLSSWMTAVSMAAVAACAVSEASPGAEVSVSLASVTLGDDCGPRTPPAPAPSQPPAAAPARRAPSKPSEAPADCDVGGCGYARHCEQTSMQLSLRSPAGTKPTTIRIKKVELLDPKGKLLQVLAAREPTRWTDRGGYVAWDQTIGANQTIAASYALEAPSWDKLTGGRYSAHNKTFQLRVTVTVGTANKTVEKQSITPAMLPPPVPT
jgi:hypothetical protein